MGTIDVTKAMRKQHETLRKVARFEYTFSEAAFATFITSCTTAASFLANLASPVVPIRDFGLFTGLLVICNYISLICIVPLALVIQDDVNLMWYNVCCCCCALEEQPDSNHQSPRVEHDEADDSLRMTTSTIQQSPVSNSTSSPGHLNATTTSKPRRVRVIRTRRRAGDRSPAGTRVHTPSNSTQSPRKTTTKPNVTTTPTTLVTTTPMNEEVDYAHQQERSGQPPSSTSPTSCMNVVVEGVPVIVDADANDGGLAAALKSIKAASTRTRSATPRAVSPSPIHQHRRPGTSPTSTPSRAVFPMQRTNTKPSRSELPKQQNISIDGDDPDHKISKEMGFGTLEILMYNKVSPAIGRCPWLLILLLLSLTITFAILDYEMIQVADELPQFFAESQNLGALEQLQRSHFGSGGASEISQPTIIPSCRIDNVTKECVNLACPGTTQECNGNGFCNRETGTCICEQEFRGVSCGEKWNLNALVAEDQAAWLALYSAFNGNVWNRCANSANDACSCLGVQCDDATGSANNQPVRYIQSLNLAGIGLVAEISDIGVLVDQINEFRYISSVDVSDNPGGKGNKIQICSRKFSSRRKFIVEVYLYTIFDSWVFRHTIEVL
jgi:hypothetical protein